MSVQRSTAADAVDGHLAWGVLVDRDQVAVPGPLGWLSDPLVRFDVLLASTHRNGGGLVERIAVDRAELHGLREHPEGAVAVLQLVHPARHRSSYGGGFRAERLAAGVAGDGDVWVALEQLGAVPQEVRGRPVPEVLGPVVGWEKNLRQGLVRDRLSTTPGEFGLNICCIWGCRDCHPLPPGDDPSDPDQ